MREPLALAHSNTCSAYAACMLQMMYVLELIEEHDIMSVIGLPDWSGGQPDADNGALRIALGYGAYMHNISAINPELLLGDTGREHLLAVWAAYRVYPEDVPRDVSEILPETRGLVRTRMELAAHPDFQGRITNTAAIGNAAHLQWALSSGAVVRVVDRWTYLSALLLPGSGNIGLRVFNPLYGKTQPATIQWAMGFMAPDFECYSTQQLH